MKNLPLSTAAWLLSLSLLALAGCTTSANNPTAPAPVTVIQYITPTFTFTSTFTITSSPTSTPTKTPTTTQTPVTIVAVATNTFTLTFTTTFSATATPTNSFTPPYTATATNSPTFTPSNSPTNSPTVTPIDSPTDSPTITATDTPTNSPTITPTDTPSDTPTNSPTDTPSATPSATPTATTCANYGLTDENGGLGSTFQAYYYANQITVASPTTAQALNVFAYDFNSTAETVYLALYDTGSGNQLAYGSFQLNHAGSGTNGLIETVTLGSPVSLAAGTYTLVTCVPTGSTQFSIGTSTNKTQFDYGIYAGGVPPTNYSSFSSLASGFFNGDDLYLQACP